jgi:hypothetical protein
MNETIKMLLPPIITSLADRITKRLFGEGPPEKKAPDRPPETARVYPARSMVNFALYGGKIRHTFWVCGTSLKRVHEQFIDTVLAGKTTDFKIMLPDPGEKNLSGTQLRKYNKRKEQPYVDQVKECQEAYEAFKKALRNHNVPAGDHLRVYPGIMFQNITVFDDQAFISFYDAAGNGADNITIHCGQNDTVLLGRIRNLFADMWENSKVKEEAE